MMSGELTLFFLPQALPYLPFIHIFVEALDAVFERWVGAKQPAKKPWLERVHHKHISA